ncbi:MAG: hypothetical protein R3274_07565 [Desulfobacterales bacterium]|nr:hypothetical protein [Desulfobacterales bacterium]
MLIKAIFDPHINRSTWVQELIKPGDMFDIKIIEVKDDQRALVDFGKFRALAKIQFPVKDGADFVAKVTDTAGQLRLQVIDAGTGKISEHKAASHRLEILSLDLFQKIQSDIKQAAQQILQASPDSKSLPENIRTALSALEAHFASLDLNQDIRKWMPLIKSYVENSGFFFEKKIAELIRQISQRPEVAASLRELSREPLIQQMMRQDLKPVILMLKAYLDTFQVNDKFPDANRLANFKGTLELLLSDIHDQQSRAVRKHESAEPHQVFTFTLPLKANRKKARLKVYCPKKKQGVDHLGFKISLLLEMDRIGEIRTDFLLLKKDLTITFFVKDDATRTQVINHYPEIRDPLASFFDYLVLKTVISQKKIDEFHHADLELESDRQIDLRI